MPSSPLTLSPHASSSTMTTVYEIPTLTRDFGDPDGEITACRNECALFDFSFVQRAEVEGDDAKAIVQSFATRDLSDMSPGKIRYALRLGENETLVSDLTIWKLSDKHYEVMSGHPQDVRDLQSIGDACVRDLSADSAIFAVQGPKALAKLAPHCERLDQLSGLNYFEHTALKIGEANCRVGRLGYTGEAGFELICSRADATQLWERLAEGIRPAGFIAADVLRIEAGFPLFWNDFALPVTAHEAGLSAFARSSPAPSRAPLQRICFTASCADKPILWRAESAPLRPGRPGEVVVTSACFSARAGGVLGLGYVLAGSAAQAKMVNPIGQFQDIRVRPLPFYDFAKQRPRADWG